MTNALPTVVAEHLDTAAGKALTDAGAVWFRWNDRTREVVSSGHVLKSTPEQMSRPGTSVFIRVGDGDWKRYA